MYISFLANDFELWGIELQILTAGKCQIYSHINLESVVPEGLPPFDWNFNKHQFLIQKLWVFNKCVDAKNVIDSRHPAIGAAIGSYWT